MATFTLPKNSKITGKAKVHKAEGATNIKNFKVYRYDPDSGENPRYDTFEIDLGEVEARLFARVLRDEHERQERSCLHHRH